MYMKYCKPSLNITQQIELIESRGMVINDRLRAERHLSNISYYRLSAYMIPYKERDDFGNRKDEFKVGTRWDQVIDLYRFDRKNDFWDLTSWNYLQKIFLPCLFCRPALYAILFIPMKMVI